MAASLSAVDFDPDQSSSTSQPLPRYKPMATRSRLLYNCRIFHAIQLQAFNPNQPFSTVGGYADIFRASHVEDGELALKRLRWGTRDTTDGVTDVSSIARLETSLQSR